MLGNQWRATVSDSGNLGSNLSFPSQLPFSPAEITEASPHHLAAARLNVLVNNRIVAHPVEACWVNPIKKLGQGGMPWLKQLRDMSVTR
jgi:hypothetical protein